VLITLGGAIVASGAGRAGVSGTQTVWPIYLLAAPAWRVSSFDPPARQALVPISCLVSICRTRSTQHDDGDGRLGAGRRWRRHRAFSGVGWACAVNAISFLFVVVALLMMRDVPATDRSAAHARDSMSLAAAKDGLRFVFGQPMIRSTMLVDFFATFFASAMALLPIYAQDILHVGAKGYGILAAAPAVGAVLGSTTMLVMSHRIGRQGRVLVWAVVAYGVSTIVFGFSHVFWITFACLAASGAADSVSMVIRNLIRNLETPDAMRGRMVGVNMIFFMGGPQLGELEAGMVAQAFGAPASVVTGGLGCVLATALIVRATPELWRYTTQQTT
jgi:predicted MFS family arabinose efflux permease